MFLRKAELDYLTSNRRFEDEYTYTIRSRLVKKIKHFANPELPLLIENGYLTVSCKVTNNCKVQQKEWPGLVRIPPQTNGDMLELSNGLGGKRKEKREEMGRARFELAVPAMSRRYPNQARPPAQTYNEKFVAQIYVVDRL